MPPLQRYLPCLISGTLVRKAPHNVDTVVRWLDNKDFNNLLELAEAITSLKFLVDCGQHHFTYVYRCSVLIVLSNFFIVLPIAVMVHFDSYSGSTFHNDTVPITSSSPHLVFIRRPVLTSAAASQAGVGSHRPQVSGSHSGQSSHQCRQERVLNRPHICSLLTCPPATRPPLQSSLPISAAS